MSLDTHPPTRPAALPGIEASTAAMGFTMASDVLTGSLLRTLAASKPGGAFLELGTGTGLATAWLLDGMDAASSLLTVDNDEAVVAVAREHLAHDGRVSFVVEDGASVLARLGSEGRTFDFIFADTWPGKYYHLDDALQLVETGGLYVVDDMRPQPNWPDDHLPKVERLIHALTAQAGFKVTLLNWSTGLILAAKVA